MNYLSEKHIKKSQIIHCRSSASFKQDRTPEQQKRQIKSRIATEVNDHTYHSIKHQQSSPQLRDSIVSSMKQNPDQKLQHQSSTLSFKNNGTDNQTHFANYLSVQAQKTRPKELDSPKYNFEIFMEALKLGRPELSKPEKIEAIEVPPQQSEDVKKDLFEEQKLLYYSIKLQQELDKEKELEKEKQRNSVAENGKKNDISKNLESQKRKNDEEKDVLKRQDQEKGPEKNKKTGNSQVRQKDVASRSNKEDTVKQKTQNKNDLRKNYYEQQQQSNTSSRKLSGQRFSKSPNKKGKTPQKTLNKRSIEKKIEGDSTEAKIQRLREIKLKLIYLKQVPQSQWSEDDHEFLKDIYNSNLSTLLDSITS